MPAKLRKSPSVRKSTFKYNWTNADIEREVAKLPDEVKLYWDYRDELSTEDIAKIVADGLEGLDDVQDELTGMNHEEFWRLQEAAIEERLDDMRRRGSVSVKCERRLRAAIAESDKLLSNADLKTLARQGNRGGYFTVTVDEPEMSFQSWRGAESKGQVDELCALCAILNVNPAHLKDFISDRVDNDNRPSYAPEPVVFPDHPERDGHELVPLEDFLSEVNESTHGGQLVFMFALDVADLIEDPDAYRNGPLKICKGTAALIVDFGSGAGTPGEMALLKDLVLPAGSYTLRYDASTHHGLQSVYGFTSVPWKQGERSPPLILKKPSHSHPMTQTPAKPVTTNPEQQLYVIPCGGGYSCWGFQNAWTQLIQMIHIVDSVSFRLTVSNGLEIPHAADSPHQLVANMEAARERLFGSLVLYECAKVAQMFYAKSPRANSTWFDPGTPYAVQRALELCRKGEQSVRLWLGDPGTGCAWLEEHDTIGRVYRSVGPMRVPILVTKGHNGGGAISTGHVVRIRPASGGKDIYRHPKFHLPCLRVVDSTEKGYEAAIETREYSSKTTYKNEVYSNHKTYAEACALVAWFHGETYKPQSN